MNSPLHQLSRPALLSLAKAFETERIQLPCSGGSISSHVPDTLSVAVCTELNRLHSIGMKGQLMAQTLYLLATEREVTQQRYDAVDLVWSGEELPGSASRDTFVVVQELFKAAQKSILIASYAIDTGKKGQSIFKELANHMDVNPDLDVRMFINVNRPYKDTTPESILLRKFSEEFRNNFWPGHRLPNVFYDPRALDFTKGPRGCLHAKCVIIDEERLLVTSANFTEAAHQRNIEAGVLMNDSIAARTLRSQFETLVTKKILQKVPGL